MTKRKQLFLIWDCLSCQGTGEDIADALELGYRFPVICRKCKGSGILIEHSDDVRIADNDPRRFRAIID